MAHWIWLGRESLEPLGGQPFGTRQLVRWLIDQDARFNASGDGIRASVALDKELEEAKEAEWLKVEQDRHFELLKASANQPQPVRPEIPPYPVHPARKALPYVEDIVKATDKLPKVLKKGAVENPLAK